MERKINSGKTNSSVKKKGKNANKKIATKSVAKMPPPDTNSSMIAKVTLVFNFRCAEEYHLVNLAFSLCSIIAILVSCFKFLSLFISSIGKNCYFKISIVFLRHVFMN